MLIQLYFNHADFRIRLEKLSLQSCMSRLQYQQEIIRFAAYFTWLCCKLQSTKVLMVRLSTFPRYWSASENNITVPRGRNLASCGSTKLKKIQTKKIDAKMNRLKSFLMLLFRRSGSVWFVQSEFLKFYCSYFQQKQTKFRTEGSIVYHSEKCHMKACNHINKFMKKNLLELLTILREPGENWLSGGL